MTLDYEDTWLKFDEEIAKNMASEPDPNRRSNYRSGMKLVLKVARAIHDQSSRTNHHPCLPEQAFALANEFLDLTAELGCHTTLELLTHEDDETNAEEFRFLSARDSVQDAFEDYRMEYGEAGYEKGEFLDFVVTQIIRPEKAGIEGLIDVYTERLWELRAWKPKKTGRKK